MSHAVVLRESGRAQDQSYNLKGLVDPAADSGVAAGASIVEFVDALLGADEGRLSRARAALEASLGPAGVTAVSVVAANFSKNDRIANATGIPLEAMFVRGSEDFRADLGVDGFASAKNSLEAYARGDES